METATITTNIARQHALQINNITNTDYFTSPEASILFKPRDGEEVSTCLLRRNDSFKSAFSGDSDLTDVISRDIIIDDMTPSQIHHIRMRCIYLRRSYENALLYMNDKTWTECIKVSIEQLKAVGIDFVVDPQTIRTWNIQFRNTERFDVPHNKKHLEPKLFSYFPEARIEFTEYCNKKVKTGELCTELAHAELTQVIVPNCYNKWVQDIDDYPDIISYHELLSALDMKNISISSTWRYLHHMGYTYDYNKRCYYTDGHERDDVVDDRDNRFLDSYFALELESYRWVQLKKEDALNLSSIHEDFNIDPF